MEELVEKLQFGDGDLEKEGRVLLLTGLGGAGKTTLMEQVARRVQVR